MKDAGAVQPGPGEQLAKFACLDCRRPFKRAVADIGKRTRPRPIEVRRCPSCGGDAYLMGSDFRAPPRGDVKAWEVVAFLVRAGLPYFRLSEVAGPASTQVAIGSYPETMAEARAFVARHRDQAQPIVRGAG